jgi:uncharacterized protein YgiM (DUF1202 family)
MATKKTTAAKEPAAQTQEPKATKKKTASKTKPVMDPVPEEIIEPEKDIGIQTEEKIIKKEEKAKPAGKTYTVRVKTKLNVRAGAGKDNRIIRQLDDGATVTASEEKDGWAKIGSGEWVDKRFLR